SNKENIIATRGWISILEVKLFDWDNLPIDEIAFPTVHWMLGHEREVMAKGYSGPFANPG
ncbi:MAG: hypothetical protein KKG78_04340, partial [Alphaproteobacteria bacterium]|nr:hypothetical protein [Alphaproteobacteria bacterium]